MFRTARALTSIEFGDHRERFAMAEDQPSGDVVDAVQIGARLQAARESAGLSTQDVADRLNLRVSTVTAIEAGRGDQMIGEVYARSHIKTMAALLGVTLTEEV